ncbi:GcrA family cell cycle regulator [Gluconacetobacter dulcium]
MEWTEETIARLRALWQQGLSTAEIGRQLSVTKNAVVGKAHRLGLQARPSPIRRRPASAGAAEPGEAVVAPAPALATASAPATETAAAASASVVVPPAVSPVVAAAPAPVAVVPSAVVPPVVAPVVPVAPRVAEAAPVVSPVRQQAEPVPQAPVRAEREPVVQAVPPPPPVVAPSVSRPETPRAPLRAVSSPAPRRSGLSCCWPLGDPGTPGFHFCGATPVPGKPYCAEHAQLAYVKLRDRRDNVA